MLYSHNTDLEKISVFAMFLEDAISGTNKYQVIVDRVITDAHELSKDTDYIYKIDRNYFSVITLLSNKAPEVFKNLSKNQSAGYDKGTYQTVISYLPQLV
jgi:hypothetical protein